jgi:hypothetical protein
MYETTIGYFAGLAASKVLAMRKDTGLQSA